MLLRSTPETPIWFLCSLGARNCPLTVWRHLVRAALLRRPPRPRELRRNPSAGMRGSGSRERATRPKAHPASKNLEAQVAPPPGRSPELRTDAGERARRRSANFRERAPTD